MACNLSHVLVGFASVTFYSASKINSIAMTLLEYFDKSPGNSLYISLSK